jgi:hypothetical protein
LRIDDADAGKIDSSAKKPIGVQTIGKLVTLARTEV